jgi:hypothetical protein
MEVLTLTTLFSVLFAVLFFALFLRVRRNGDSCADQDSLIPFRGDELRPVDLPAEENDLFNVPK